MCDGVDIQVLNIIMEFVSGYYNWLKTLVMSFRTEVLKNSNQIPFITMTHSKSFIFYFLDFETSRTNLGNSLVLTLSRANSITGVFSSLASLRYRALVYYSCRAVFAEVGRYVAQEVKGTTIYSFSRFWQHEEIVLFFADRIGCHHSHCAIIRFLEISFLYDVGHKRTSLCIPYSNHVICLVCNQINLYQ